MKWLAAVGGLIVGAFISPVAAFIMAVAGWFVGGAMSKGAAPAKDETPTVDPEDVAALRRQVQKLGQRVSELESQVAQLARGMAPGAPPASAAAATAATPAAARPPRQRQPRQGLPRNADNNTRMPARPAHHSVAQQGTA